MQALNHFIPEMSIDLSVTVGIDLFAQYLEQNWCLKIASHTMMAGLSSKLLEFFMIFFLRCIKNETISLFSLIGSLGPKLSV